MQYAGNFTVDNINNHIIIKYHNAPGTIADVGYAHAGVVLRSCIVAK